MLFNELQKIITSTAVLDEGVRHRFLARVKEGRLTRDENPVSHCCVYFFPYNPNTGKVFIVHHKKSGLWISPGGHIDKGETLLKTLNREIQEELGVVSFFSEQPHPFLFTITPIDNEILPCKEHLDIWFMLKTDGKYFIIDDNEFFDTRWMTFKEADSIVKDKANMIALERVRNQIITS